MNDSDNPRVAAEQARDTFEKTAAQFEKSALDTPLLDNARRCREECSSDTRDL